MPSWEDGEYGLLGAVSDQEKIGGKQVAYNYKRCPTCGENVYTDKDVVHDSVDECIQVLRESRDKAIGGAKAWEAAFSRITNDYGKTVHDSTEELRNTILRFVPEEKLESIKSRDSN